MKVSLNLVKKYTKVDESVGGLAEIIGRQLGAIDEIVDLGELYRGIFVVKVIDCHPHPNADRLNVCWIDDGNVVKDAKRDNRGLIQVVCGAPNVRAGQYVAWISPGSKIPVSKGNETVDAKDIRGVVSQGMLASLKELGLGDDHSGILVINDPVTVGRSLADLYDLNDTIIDIENKMFTHRPDCFGQLGVAREIAGITHRPFHSPEWYLKSPKLSTGSKELPLNVKNEIPKLVPRLMAQVVKDVSVKPSSAQLQSYLSRLGIRPINNIVDETNYFMLLTGQPLHAYDYDKLLARDPGAKSATLIARKPKDGETIKLLSGKTITINHDAILIASATKAVGVGGVMGGFDTEVDDSTKNIVVECATFDMYSIRRTSMVNGLFTDAVTRFTKGQSPWQNDRVLAEACREISKVTGGKLLSTYDTKAELSKANKLTVSAKFVSDRLGLVISAKEVASLLSNVEFDTKLKGIEEVEITPPFWRTDIELDEDIVEEVGRLYDYSRLPLKLPTHDLAPASKDAMIELRSRIRLLLSKAGANEVLTYSFVHGRLLDQVGQDKKLAFKLSNALSPDAQYYRLSLAPSLLDKVHPNVKAGFLEFVLFEMGKVHVIGHNDENEPNLPKEDARLAIVWTADDRLASKYPGAAYYQAARYLDFLLKSLGVNYESETYHDAKGIPSQQLLAPFEPSRTGFIKSDGKWIGVVGEPKQSIKQTLKLPKLTAMIELDLETLLELATPNQPYHSLSRFPRVEQDICLRVANEVTYQDIYQLASAEIRRVGGGSSYFTLSPVDIYQDPKNKKYKQITLRLNISSYDKTLVTKEVADMLLAVAKVAKSEFGATLV